MAPVYSPNNVRYTPVPNSIFGPVLEQIDDINELKCILRVIWLLHQKKGYPKYVGIKELLSDRILAKSLSESNEDLVTTIQDSLERAVAQGIMITNNKGDNGTFESLYALNLKNVDLNTVNRDTTDEESFGNIPAPENIEQRPNIFSLYEDNVGLLTPMIAEKLKEAEDLYPRTWIEKAFREAVENNKRSWRYIITILNSWERQGRADGGTGRHPEKTGYQEYFRR